MECKITYKGKEYRLPEFAQYLADEGIAEAIENNVIKDAKFIKAYEKLFVAPKAVQPSAKKITQPQAEIQFKVNKIAEDDAENKHAEQQLQKEDNIEQEPNVQAIERQAESNDKAELEEVIRKVEEIKNNATDVQVVEVASISTDEARFQNRDELDEERVNKIAEGWNDAEQDPIHVWRDEKDGKLYVLSGHHRLQAAKKANRKTVKIIDRTNDFTEERAIKFATEEANTNRAMETPLERAKIYRSDIEKGMSGKELEDKAKRLEGKNSIYILALAYLNPKGKVMNMLNSLKENTDKENIRQAEKIAQWVGEARKRFDLTNEHENELYDALMDEMFSKRITNKVDFLQKVGSIVGEIEYDKNKPLNIRRFREVSAGQEEYDRLTSEIKTQIEGKMSEVQDIKKRFTDPSASNYIPSTAKDYEQAKENADNKIASINAEIRALQSQLQELIRNKGKYLRAPQTGSLFDFQQIKKRLNTISPKLFNKLLERLKKAFPKAKLNTFKESDLEAMLPEMSAEPVIGGIKYKKDATMPRATSIVKMKALDLSNELYKNNFGKRITRTSSKEASDKIDIAKENIQKAQKDNSIITSPIQVGYVLTEDGRVELQVLKGQEYLAAMQELGIEELAIEIPNSDLKTLQDRFETPVQKALKRHGLTAYKGMLTKLSKAKQKDKLTEENVQFFRLKDGTIYGFKTPDGQVFINEDKMNANTPIHEYGHVWQSMFPTEFGRGIELLKASKKGQKLIKEISQNPAYKDKTQQEIEAEALVTAIGDMGESYFEGNQLTRFIDWVKDLFRKIGQRFGVQITPDTTLDMFTREVVRNMLGGKELLAEDDKYGTFEMMINGVPTKVKRLPNELSIINGFYSPIEKNLMEYGKDKIKAKDWLNVVGKGDEAVFTGVRAFLEGKDPNAMVSKQEILDYMKDNRISVVEVVKDGIDKKQKLEKKLLSKLTDGMSAEDKDIIENMYDLIEISSGHKSFSDYVQEMIENDDFQKSDENYLKVINKYNKISELDNIIFELRNTKNDEVRFSQYQLEGEKENYKEVLVTLPNDNKQKQIQELESFRQELKNKYGDGFKGSQLTDEEVDRLQELKQKAQLSKDKFKSTHFEEPNILVHLRMNTRTDAEGNKVLFLEEVQSDWGQKGKKEGFYDINEINNLKKKEEELKLIEEKADKDLKKAIDKIKEKNKNASVREELDNKNVEITRLYNESQTAFKNRLNVSDKIKKLQGSRLIGGDKNVPTAPFVMDTNAWTKLGLKVALKEAVAQGADKIAWTTGTQQFDRWGTEKIDWVANKKLSPLEKAQFDLLDYKVKSQTATQSEKEKRNELGRRNQGGFVINIQEQFRGTAFEGMNVDEKALSEKGILVETKEDLKAAIDRTLSREKNETERQKLTDRIWDRMQKEDSGTSLPRKEGMESFYGTEGTKGIVGGVAEKVFGQKVGETKIIDKDTPSIYKRYQDKKTELEQKEKRINVLYDIINSSTEEKPKEAREYNLLIDEVQDLRKEIKDIERTSPNALKQGKSTSTQPSIDITPELIAQVREGLPLFQIVGENAQLAQDIRDNLQVARDMETVGKDAKTIRLATGWEKGKDGKWRYEIEDYIQSVSDVYDLQGKSKGEVIVNADTLVSKELNKLYPQLKDVSVKINIDSKNDNQGSYETVTINNQKQLKYNQITVNATDVAKAQSILLHEIQHAIQGIEGFAKGGSPENALNILRAELIDAVKNIPKYKELTEKRETLIKQGKSIFSEEVSQVEKQRDVFLMFYAAMQTKSGRWSEAKFNAYQRLAGEVEARNVETRMGMTPEQRRATTLQETEDVAREEQIVLFEAGVQQSISITPKDIEDIIIEEIDSAIQKGESKEDAVMNALDNIKKQKTYTRLVDSGKINEAELEDKIKAKYGVKKQESGKKKAHRVISRIINESNVVTAEQKIKLLEDEDSYYRVLTTDMIKQLSKEIIDKLGIDEALRIVNDNDENYSLPIRGMLMGQLISHYQEQYNKIRGTSKVEEVSAAELEIGEKLHALQQKLANEATLAGQFIYHIRTIYEMSGFAIETKVKRMIDESNKADGKDADKTIKELRELLLDKKAAIESALESFQKEQEGETKSLKEQIQLLEKEISELKLKADGRDVSKRTGAKGNPIKIKRYTDKDKAEEIKKKLFGKTRIGIGDLDELGYLSLYYIEELLNYGSAKIDGVIGKYDKRYYNKNKQEVIEAYVNARDVAIEQGVSEELLSTDEEITDYLGAQEQERVAKEIAKKQAQLLKLRNKLAAENNPDSARKQAPVEAAKMVVSDTKTILNLKDTKNEGTYLKKLVRLLHAKAKEKYKEKNKKEPKSILETIAFALENASSQRELWDGLINSIEQQIDNDENLSEAEKDSVKDFIETYVEQMIDTLVTESNQERLINEILKEKYGKEKRLPTPISRDEARKTLSNKKAKLVDENGSPITTAQQINSANQIFKVITSIDWKDILRNENSINEINDKIDEVIDGTGITGAEVELFKQKLKDRFALRYQDVVEKKVAQFLNERNRGKLPKAFSGLSRNARKIAKLESAGILSDDRIKEVLQETLGIRSLTDDDVRYIRDLVNRIKTESKIMFYKEKLEEELQYFIKKKTDSTIWGFMNDQTAVGQFGSATNFVQNLSNVFEQIPVIVRTIAALKSPKLAMQILAEAYKESLQISKTIFVTGDVGRGVAFTDILGTREGQPRVRYLEYFKPTGIYGQMFGKKINLLPTTTTKNISKYVLRLFEAVDVYTSAVVAQMSTAIYLKKRLMAQGMTEAQATRKIRAMYLENNFAQDMRDSEEELKKQGLKNPTQAQIKRGAYELAERRRNEEDENKFAVRLGETLGQILTGKKTQTGLLNLPYIAADAIMRKFKGIKTEGAKEEVGSTSWRTIKAGSGYLIDRVAFPFFKAISNFTELAIEWTPYGIAKGAFYSASGIARAKFFKTTPYEIAENQHYAVNVTVKSIMGTVMYYALTNMIFGGGDDEEDKMKINAPSYGIDPYQKERVEDLVQAPKTLGVKDKTPIPLDMFGTLGGGMYMYEAANQAIQKAIDDAYSRIGGKENIKKMNKEQKQDFENMKMEMVSKYLFTAMSGVTFDLRDSYFRRLTKPDMSIIGKPLGSLVVPLNAVQKEIGMYINPLTRESKGMANFVNNFSVMKAFDTSKPALDWRGREYKQYEVYPNNVIGLFNMMKDNKYTDELDIAFADMGMSLKNNSQYTIDIERNKVTINGLPLTDRQFEMYDREYKIAIGKQLSNNKNQILYDYTNKNYDIVDKRLSIYKQLARATALANVKKAEIQ